MTATTHPEFNDQTEALEVAKAFADRIRGKTVLITGVNRKGVGYGMAEAIASQSPAHLIIATRSRDRAQESIDALRASYPSVDYRFLELDLSRQAAVRAAAAELLSWEDVPAVDLVINNAAVMGIPERTLTEDGLELQFATNHVGHFLFTCSIMPKLLRAATSNPRGATRIVNISSLSPTVARMRWSDLRFEKRNADLPAEEQPFYPMQAHWGVKDAENKSYLPMEGYNQGKVGNLLFAIAATRRLYERHGILALAAHPGIIQTELGRDFAPETTAAMDQMEATGFFTFRTQGAGAATGLVAALDPALGAPEARNGKENWGSYLVDCQISDRATALAESTEQAERLWGVTEELVKEKFSW